jgi:hypothetical protein
MRSDFIRSPVLCINHFCILRFFVNIFDKTVKVRLLRLNKYLRIIICIRKKSLPSQ